MTYVLIGLIALLASFSQAATGFGYALVCMALWPLLIPFRAATVLELITVLFTVGVIVLRYRKHIKFKIILWPLVGSLVFNTIGIFLLVSSAESLLRRILGVMFLGLAVYFFFFSERVRIKPTRTAGLVAGAIGGLFGGMLGVGGPPMVVYLTAITDDKIEYNATLQFYFLISTVYALIVHSALGSVTGQTLLWGAAAFAGMVVGTFAGLLLFKRLSMANIKKLMSPLFAVMGIYYLWKG